MSHVDTEYVWSQLMDDLGALIDDLPVGDAVTIAIADREQFVRATHLRSGQLRIEAVSNGHLPPGQLLDLESLDLLEDLGWLPPNRFTDDADDLGPGCSNHHLDLPGGWVGGAVASVLVRTLRGVYEVSCPTSLDLRSRRRSDALALAAPAMPTSDGILSEILTALSAFTPIDAVVPVDLTEGIVRITASGDALTVLYDPAHHLVRAAVEVMPRVTATAQSMLVINDCGRPMRCGRLEWRDGTVFALVDLPAVTSVGRMLVDLLMSVRANLDGFRDALAPYTEVA